MQSDGSIQNHIHILYIFKVLIRANYTLKHFYYTRINYSVGYKIYWSITLKSVDMSQWEYILYVDLRNLILV